VSRATAFDLDERQRAMLAEMGVRIWQPAPAAVQSDEAGPPARPAATAAPAVLAGAPTQAQEQAGRAVVPPPRAEPALLAGSAAVRGTRPAGVEAMDWPALRAAVTSCEACGLCASRRNTVFGVGDPQARWMVIGEAPGENEDIQGEPFVGQAGKLLDNMLQAIGLSRTGAGEQGVYIANVLKCRPPANRNPLPEEVVQCEPFLRRQVALVQPRIILAMGRFAVQSLLQTQEPIGKLRGQVHQYQGVPVVVTYHPAYLLRNLPDKAKAWADLCLALETLQQIPAG
jgi:uracil-DNA glycosylase